MIRSPSSLARAAFFAQAGIVSILGLTSTAFCPEDGEERVDFGRDIRPILSDNCFACHGPDRESLEGDLRLDLKSEAFRDLGGYFALKPGRSADSELYLRISDPGDPMPPDDSGKDLSADEIELIRRWIDQGAQWEEHWSYVPVTRTPAPTNADQAWAQSDIDRFILARLETEQLRPEPEAARETLIRRASLDLTGLPPTREQVDAFLADEAPDAFGRLIDRLLSSPRYGEHMARMWLDSARYGDTHGYHLDNLRVMWPYRDWVIAAYNTNMPFDQFTVEQLAGDLLPEPTIAQRVATGFNRCNPTSAEGGMIADEFMALYAADRVVTTSTVWLGTTMLCAQCHDHKFDPIAQKEFYGLFGFFNNISESASYGNAPSPPPVIAVPSAEQRLQLDELESAIAAAEAELEAPLPEVDAAQAAWEAEWTEQLSRRWQPVEAVAFSSENGASMRLLDDGSIFVEGKKNAQDVFEVLLRTDVANVTALRLEALSDDALPERGPGRAINGNFVLSGFEVMAVSRARPGAFAPVQLEAAFASFSQSNFPVAGAIDPSKENGWGVHRRNTDHEAWFIPRLTFGGPEGTLVKVRLRFETPHEDHQIGRFRLQVSDDPTLRVVEIGTWHALGPLVTEAGADDRETAYDEDFGPEQGVDLERTYATGELSWVEHPEWGDGEIHELAGEYCATYLYRTITAPDARTLSLSLGSDDAVKVWLNQELVLDERVARGAAPDQNRIDLTLVAGENHLLMKVVNYGGEYAFTTRRADEAVGGLPVGVAGLLGADERTEEAERELRDFYR
ncbi:MAG: DUF1549 domain-containing protein, partial [Deltaproteobacteria bacterium]|nr:DUF1549 domain-containing protein [Deltaproteobacteria bacterium]